MPLMRTARDISKPILIVAILLRVAIFLFLNPNNNDDHAAVVRYWVEHGRFPAALLRAPGPYLEGHAKR